MKRQKETIRDPLKAMKQMRADEDHIPSKTEPKKIRTANFHLSREPDLRKKK